VPKTAAANVQGSQPSEPKGSPWATRHEREPARQAKKDAVLLAAARLFTKNGFQHTSLDDIARSLGVSKPTLYYYVDNKEQILFDCVERGLAEFHTGLAQLQGQGLNGRERLRAAMALYASVVTGDFGQCVIRLGEDTLPEERRRELRRLKRQVDADFRGLIDEGMLAGWIVAGDAAVASFTVVGALSGIGRWYRPGQHSAEALRHAVDLCLEMLLRGVLSEPTAQQARPDQTGDSMPLTRRETHFQNRVMRCYSDRPVSLGHMLQRAAQAHPDAPALVSGELRLSWRELQHTAARYAAGLARLGVQPGDRVALHMANRPEFVLLALACAWMGAVLVPISDRARGLELAHALADSGAVVVVCAPELVEWFPHDAPPQTLRWRLVCGGQASTGFSALSGLLQGEPMAQPHAAHEDDLAVLLYTSGTTGKPKGAMICQLNIIHSVMHFAQVMTLGAQERTLVAVPLSHVTGLVAQLYTMLHCAGCLVLMPPFKAGEFLRLAEAERITHTIMVPAMYNLCLLLPDLQNHDLRHWRIGAFGGASMSTATIDALAQRLPGLTLMNAYGATETCSPATIMPPGQTDHHRDSVGQAVPCGEVCIVDDEGRELPRGSVGEIWIAGPMVVPGYWRNEAATASEFRGGFWRSGDIGSLDAEGYLRILDRKKDIINRGGYKVYCAAVENVLAEHPQVIEVALVGVPCAVLGERVHAFVTVRALGDDTQAPVLQAFCAERMADYAVPETWTIDTEPLPRNLNGKIVKRELRRSLNAALT